MFMEFVQLETFINNNTAEVNHFVIIIYHYAEQFNYCIPKNHNCINKQCFVLMAASLAQPF